MNLAVVCHAVCRGRPAQARKEGETTGVAVGNGQVGTEMPIEEAELDLIFWVEEGDLTSGFSGGRKEGR